MGRNKKRLLEKGAAEEERAGGTFTQNCCEKHIQNRLKVSPTEKKTVKRPISEDFAEGEGHRVALVTLGSDTMKECTEKGHRE